jgi:NitT/TauT family transport system substrate-binding protein
MKISRRAFAAGAALLCAPYVRAAALKELIVTEPAHSIGLLPFYIAIKKGFFARQGLDVKIMTMGGGSFYIDGVLSGQAFAFIGGPEHCAYAQAQGGQLRAVANVVDRGNVYFCAAPQYSPQDPNMLADYVKLGAYLKGKIITASLYGGTPNSITRYLLVKSGLTLDIDAHILETTTEGELAAVASGRAQIAAIDEPLLTQGMRAGIWGAPFLSIPKQLGPYAYSTLNVAMESIAKDPATMKGVVRGLIDGLADIYDDRTSATAFAYKEFATMPPDDIDATLKRSFSDNLWSKTGEISVESWSTASAVVMAAGLLNKRVPYDAVIDMSFVKEG